MIVVGLNFLVQLGKESPERVIAMPFDQVRDQFQSPHPTGVMILKISPKVFPALVFVHPS